MRRHWPLKFGYSESSNACALPSAIRHAVASAATLATSRFIMVSSLGVALAAPLVRMPINGFIGGRPPLFARLVEVPQVRRQLAFPRWHEHAICAQKKVLAADDDVS